MPLTAGRWPLIHVRERAWIFRFFRFAPIHCGNQPGPRGISGATICHLDTTARLTCDLSTWRGEICPFSTRPDPAIRPARLGRPQFGPRPGHPWAGPTDRHRLTGPINRSAIRAVVVAAITAGRRRADGPGPVALDDAPAEAPGIRPGRRAGPSGPDREVSGPSWWARGDLNPHIPLSDTDTAIPSGTFSPIFLSARMCP
jgi:hypothetical protein